MISLSATGLLLSLMNTAYSPKGISSPPSWVILNEYCPAIPTLLPTENLTWGTLSGNGREINPVAITATTRTIIDTSTNAPIISAAPDSVMRYLPLSFISPRPMIAAGPGTHNYARNLSGLLLPLIGKDKKVFLLVNRVTIPWNYRTIFPFSKNLVDTLCKRGYSRLSDTVKKKIVYSLPGYSEYRNGPFTFYLIFGTTTRWY